MKRIMAVIILCSLMIAAAFGQETTSSGAPEFGLDLGLGVHTFPNTDGTVDSYQFLTVSPDIALGKFGVGLDLTLNYRFRTSADSIVEIRKEDWARDSFAGNASLYLAKIRYLRYGLKGEPLYAKLGTIDDALLGNGFIMSGYANTFRLPDERFFGLSFDLDGGLFNFPYVGFETFVGDLASFDVGGVRVYARPLVSLEIPVLKNIQFGGTIAFDRDPFRFSEQEAPEDASVVVMGLDYRLPILSTGIVSLAQFADVAVENSSVGGMLGLGGRLFGFLGYGGQIRILGENFIPTYFDAGYDAYRTAKYRVYTGDISIPAYYGWAVTSGFAFLDDKLALSGMLDGPFGTPGSDDGSEGTSESVTLPHLRVSFLLGEGVIPGFFFNASYDKKSIQSFSDVFSPEDAIINAQINYRTGPAIISLYYDLKYNPDSTGSRKWDVTSGLETRITLF